ncbi:MAG: hypothetical protein AAFX06_26385 [Planctomycetota bacterium]
MRFFEAATLTVGHHTQEWCPPADVSETIGRRAKLRRNGTDKSTGFYFDVGAS